MYIYVFFSRIIKAPKITGCRAGKAEEVHVCTIQQLYIYAAQWCKRGEYMEPSSSPPNSECVNIIEGKALIYYLLEVSVYHSVLLTNRE